MLTSYPPCQLVDRTGQSLQEKAGLRQNRFAGDKWRMEIARKIHRSLVPLIVRVQPRNQWTGIQQQPGIQRPNPSICFGLVDRSPTPLLTHPKPLFSTS